MNRVAHAVRLAIVAVGCVAAPLACGKSTSLSTGEGVTVVTEAQPVTLGARVRFHNARDGFESVGRDLLARVANDGSLSVTAFRQSHALALRTERVGRDRVGLSKETIQPRLDHDGAILRPAGDAVEEKVELTSEGIEISWLVARKPEGTGDLVVRQRVADGMMAESDGRGVRFPAAHLRMSEGRFIDRSGTVAVVPASVRGDVIEYRVPHSIVEASRYPAVLDPTVSAEAVVDATEVAGSATQRSPALSFSGAGTPAVDFDGTNFLAAWIDRRGADPVVMAALVGADGSLLTPDGIVVSRLEQKNPLVSAFTGYDFVQVTKGPGGFLVSWFVPDGSSYYEPTIAQARVSSTGVVKDASPVILKGAYDLVVSASSDRFLLVMTSAINATESGLSVSTMASANSDDAQLSQYDVGVRFGAAAPLAEFTVKNDLLVYSSRNPDYTAGEIFGVRLGASAPLAAPAKLAVFPDNTYLSVLAFDGTQYAVFGAGNSGRFAHRLSTSGTPLGAQVDLTALNFYPSEVFGDAAGFVARGMDSFNAGKVCRFTSTLALVGSCYAAPLSRDSGMAVTPSTVAYTAVSNSLAGRGFRPLLQFTDRATGAAKVPTQTVLAKSANSQFAPAVAYSPSLDAYAGVWIDDADADTTVVPGVGNGPGTGGPRIVAGTIRARGAAFDAGTPVAISLSGANVVEQPAIAWDGTQFVVVWREQRTVSGTALSRIMFAKLTVSSSTASASTPMEVASSSTSSLKGPALSADSSGWLVAWSEETAGSGRVVTKRIPFSASSADGISVVGISASGDNQGRTDVVSVFDGKQSIVAWIEGPFFSSRVVGAAFADGSGTPSTEPIILDRSFSVKSDLGIASDRATGSAIAWASYSGTLRSDVRAKLLKREDLAAVNPDASLSVATAEGTDESQPSIAFANDGESYTIVWSGLAAGSGDRNLYATWLANDGRVLDPVPGRTVSATTVTAVDAADGGREAEATGEDEAFPSLSGGPTATNGLIYVRFDSRAARRSLRARFRTLVSGRISGESCASNDECSSRYCVDGICCKTACDDGCGQCGGAGGGAKGVCAPTAAKSVCGTLSRYVCSGSEVSCPITCADSTVCAPGFSCIAGQCAPFGAVCLDDVTTQTADGPFSCGAYRCIRETGVCAAECESVDQCAPGSVCGFDRRCGSAPLVENPPGGCSVSGPTSGTGSLVGLLVAGVLVGTSRRRRSQKGVRATF